MQNAFVRKIWQTAAGNIELFVGVYFVTFGALAAMFFLHRSHPNRALAAGGVSLLGILLIFRARRLLGWNAWVFWIAVLLLIAVPIGWFAPALLGWR